MNTSTPRRNWLGLVFLGLAVGLASGLFGVGGGIIILPSLIYLLGYSTKRAAGTSLLAIVLPALVGVFTYALEGNVNVLLAALLAAGSIVGAPFGSWLLAKVPKRVVQWLFILFLVIVIVSLFLVVPTRDAQVHVDVLTGALLVALGLFTGVTAGLLGIGGGVVVVPMLVVLFGASDLVAKGTSLLMIIATGLSGTISNILRKNVDAPGALVIGAAAAVVTPAGVWLASALSPFAANVTFAVFLVLIIVRMVVDAWPRRRRGSAE